MIFNFSFLFTPTNHSESSKTLNVERKDERGNNKLSETKIKSRKTFSSFSKKIWKEGCLQINQFITLQYSPSKHETTFWLSRNIYFIYPARLKSKEKQIKMNYGVWNQTFLFWSWDYKWTGQVMSPDEKNFCLLHCNSFIQ